MNLGPTVQLLRSLGVLVKRGFVHPLRLAADARSAKIAARCGPFPAMINYTARYEPDRHALVDPRGTLSYGALERQSNALARGLAAAGIGPGDIAGILARDHRGAVAAMIATGKLGVRVVIMNTGFAGPQLREVADREGVTVVFHDDEFASAATALPPSVTRFRTWDDGRPPADGTPSVDELIAANAPDPLPLPAEAGGLVLLTSGTTGTPKGAVRTKISPLQSAQLLDRVPLTRGGAMVVAAPLFHATGLGQFTLALSLGKTVVFGRGKFDAEATLASVARHRADTLILVPTMLGRILDLGPDVLARHDVSSLRIIASGGSAISPGLSARTAAAFGDVLYNNYGATEVAAVSVATPAELRRAPGTVGRPPVGVTVALFDAEGREVTAPGEPGIIHVANGLSFGGYTDGRDKDRRAGMISTGDIGHFDRSGLLFIDGRGDDMIVSGGENVYPVEVENLLADRDDIGDAAVVGVDDPDFGQRLRAFVVPHRGATVDPDEIRGYVKSQLARYKVPRDVVVVPEIPRNGSGKILRGRLAELPAEQLAD
ncbi:fatty-acyl-CoA synthase [Nocardia transvalensis]|uniref:Fatty-acyl-CoA synthase n=1 Tax=Nocardia transvalensis TaxID=37333 RepID=A0A7W9P9U0_9NOCA|nr:AMP-binding protein [Nocardia transvalensis]MBB5912161.1 fatty-acyl-CoA synthase [Nocardia transvalensis]